MLKASSKLVSASQLITPISLPGDVTLSTGNLIIGTAGKGIDFSANTSAAGMTSELLNWYEDGAWSPGFASWSVSPTVDLASYTRIGRLVTITLLAHGGTCLIGSSITDLPFSSSNKGGTSIIAINTNSTTAFTAAIFNLSSSIANVSASSISGAVYWTFSCTYFV